MKALPPSQDVPPVREVREEAFSLVEICVALSLVAFCLVALLGLFHVGLEQGRRSLDQTQAAHILEAILDDYQGMVRNPKPATAAPSGTPTSSRFKLPALKPGEASEDSIRVDDKATVVSSARQAGYVAHYRIEAPAENLGVYAPGRIQVAVAWPAAAEFDGSGDELKLRKALGYVEATLEINDE